MLQKPAVLVLQPVIQRIVRYKAFCFTRGLQAADTDRSIRPHFTGAAERRAQCIRKRDIRLAHQSTTDSPCGRSAAQRAALPKRKADIQVFP